MSWTNKHRRNGNDEIPSDRSAVKIIRSSRADNNSLGSPSKQPTVNKVTKLVYYEPKRNVPTTAVLKSIHSYRVPQDHIVEMPSKWSTMSEQNVFQPSVKEPIDDPVTPPYLRIPAVADLRNTFARKSQIQKDAKEIHEMILKGLIHESPKKQEEPKVPFLEAAVFSAAIELPDPVPSVNQSPSAATRTTGSSTRRSKTDPEITNRGRLPVTTNINQITSRSARSKSSANIKSQRTGTERTNSTAKQKSYDSERARQFIQEQRDRHRVQNQAIATQKIASKANRDEIKKRLEDLRKNTMEILKKNIRKVRKRSVEVDRYPLTGKMTAEEEEKPVVNTTPAIVSNPLKKAKTIARPTESLNQPAESQRSHAKSPRKALRSSNMDQKQEIPTNLKKIGLLRKPDSDFVVGSLDFCLDKENISLEIPQPRPQSTKPQTSRKESISKNQSPPPKLTTTTTEPTHIELPKSLPDLELTVPDVKLIQRPDVADKATQFQPPPPEKQSLPFWLQPTSVQPYPYNFIMAVRKKLEAVTNPVQVTQINKADIHKKVELTEQPTKFRPPPALSLPSEARRRLLNRRELNEVSSINIEQNSGHKLSSASSVFTAFLNSPEIFAKPNNNSRQKEPEIPGAPLADRTRSFSDITSSITINIPQSNTASEVSSIQSELGKHAALTSTRISRKARSVKNSDDTTASSSVFSSPEKQARSIRLLNRSQIRVNDGPLSPLSVDQINDLNLKSKSEVKTAEDFELMLEDFNRSLSQVIEVNQQLNSVLWKSPRSKSPSTANSKGPSNIVSSKSDNYSSDFEDAVISDPSSKSRNLVSQNNKKNVDKSSYPAATVVRKQAVEEVESEQLAPSTSAVETEIVDGTASTIRSQTTVTVDAPSSSTSDPTKISVKNSSSQSISEHLSRISIEENLKSIVGSPDRPKLNTSNNFSKDSLKPQQVSNEVRSPTKSPSFPKCQIIRNQVNTKRGDSFTVTSGADTFVIDSCETKIVPSDDSVSVRPALNTSFGSDIYAIFSQSELELSISPMSRLSESNLSYSTLGLYGQLIQTEETKTEHLTALLKIREKSILDRTKGQIALLEIQKEKCKVKGLTGEISMIRRKQRALLLKMEKEREEIKKFLTKLSEKDSSHRISKQSQPPKIPNLPQADLLLRKSPTHVLNRPCPVSIVRGCELESSHNLDLLLKEREKELQRRREHVEHLLEWHQRLDKEEEEVLRIEQMLYEYNQQKQQHNNLALPSSIKLIETAERKKQKRITQIDKSLRELQSITSCSESNTSVPQQLDSETVRISGRKMNRLWNRLTGRTADERFDQAKYYKLNKIDLEKFYEDAKVAVLQQFEENILLKILADQSSKANNISENSLASSNSSKRPKNNKSLHDTEVPNLNLNFSSGPSESEIVDTKQSMTGDTSTSNSEMDAEAVSESLTVNAKSSENKETIEIQAALSEISTMAAEPNSSPPTEREAAAEMISSKQSKSHSNLSSNSPKSDFLLSPLEEDSLSLQLKVASEEETPKSGSSMAENNLEKIPEVVQPVSSQTNSGSTSKVSSFESLKSNEVAIQARNSSDQTLATSPKRSESENDLSLSYTTPSSNGISNVIPTETDTTNHKTETNGDQTAPPTLTNNSLSYKTETYIPLTVSFDNNESASELSPPEIPLNSDSHNLPNIAAVISPHNSIDEDETMLEDISEPKFETTGDISKSLVEELVEQIGCEKDEETSKTNGDESNKSQSSSDLEKRLMDLDESLKNLHQSFDRALSPSPSPSPSNSLTNFTDLPEVVDEDKENRPHDATSMKLTVKDYLLNPEATTSLMPDIINEVELRRRQQILVESDIIQLENAVPYALLREIPNKPPPPYVPPAHGSPMTTIFPSEARIKEITFRRTKELYDEINAKDNNREYQPSSPSILHENITNIYERMILDICKECICDYQPTFTSNSVMVGNYKMPLALYNPPNRLKCIQEFVYKRVRKLLSMDKQQPRQNSILSIGRRKRDHVDEILVQELFEEEQKWTNFDLEESEVRAAVVDEIFSELVSEVVGDFEEAYKKKLQLKQNLEPQSDATGSDSAVEK